MGASVGITCFPTNQQATDFYLGTMPPYQHASGASLYEFSYVVSSSVGRSSPSLWSKQTIEYSVDGLIQKSVGYLDVPAMGFPACDESASFLDGMTVGWLIGAAFIAVAAVRLMSKGAR